MMSYKKEETISNQAPIPKTSKQNTLTSQPNTTATSEAQKEAKTSL